MPLLLLANIDDTIQFYDSTQLTVFSQKLFFFFGVLFLLRFK